MDRNFILAIALSFAVVFTYQTWRSHHQPAESLSAASNGEAREAGTPERLAGEEAAPEGGTLSPAESALQTRPTESAAEASTHVPEQHVMIENELYRTELTTRGASINAWQLKRYRQSSAADALPIELAPGSGPGRRGLVTPFVELGVGDLSEARYELLESDATHAVFALTRNGVTIRKRFDVVADNYALSLRVEVQNRGGAAVNAGFSATWPAVTRHGSDFTHESLIVLHNGSITREMVSAVGKRGFFSGGGEPATVRFRGDVDWAGVDSTYFLVALVPAQPRDAIAAFEPGPHGESAAVWLGYPPSTIPPGLSDAREYRVFAGPKERALLEAFGSGVEASVQLGWRWIAPLTKAFLWLLHAVYAFIPNYGVGIILLTLLVRLVTYPLNVRQMSSMKRMSELQPKVQEIQKKYADDRQKQSEAMMQLYREAGVNPLGGCFPILLQFPVLMGLYYALQSSIDLRQAPFVGWIHDLSAPEALFVLPVVELPVRFLPIVMGASMFVQQRLTPSTMDPAQARMMMTVMPVMFTVMFYQLPSGLVLYWFVSNLLAIGSQVWMQRGSQTSPVRS